MKKKSRFLTGLLSAVMALSLCAMPAMAEGEIAPVSTIDTTRKGSLTIEKYEGDTTKPLEGVEFTIYKVADIEQTKDEAGSVGVNYKSLVNGVDAITSETTYNDIKTQVDSAVESGKLTGTAQTTALNSDGKACVKFTNLDLGIYLVVETKAPSQVVTRSANFLVSIPMTNETGEGWVYDVVAQPKNTTVYGGITLVKYGKSGNDSETVLAGATFVLQRNDGDSWTTLKKQEDGKWVANESDDLTNAILTTSNDGSITVDNLEPGKYRFIEISAPNGYIADGKATYTFTITTDDKGKLTYNIPAEYKYGDANAIKVVNEKPDLDKTVKKSDDTYDTDADYSVGDMVEWKVSATVPSKVDELKTFKITDTMSAQLTWVTSDADLTIATDNDTVLDKGTDYTLTTPEDGTEGGEWTIEFTDAGKKKLKDSKVSRIDVTFKAKLNEKANVGKDGNLNDAKLEYSNAIYPTEDPSNPNEGKEPKIDVIKDQSIVYTFLLDAVKVDGSNIETKLAGAEFDLYRYNGTETNPTEAKLKEAGELVGHYKSDENGKLNITGLKKGTYYLVETKAPTYTDTDGKEHSYNLLKEPVKVEISPAYATKTTTTTTTDEDGVTTTETVVENEKMGNAGSNGTFTVTIKNNKGFDLPVTGGFGTLLFSAIGVLLVVGGVGVLMSTKKKKGNA